MNRSELIAQLVERHPEMEPQEVVDIVNAVFEVIISELSEGKRVELRGFGVFSTRLRKANVGCNPFNGKPVNIPAKHVCHFKTGRLLHQKLNP